MAPPFTRLVVVAFAMVSRMLGSHALHTGTGMMKAAVFVEKGRIEIRQKPIPKAGFFSWPYPDLT